MKVIIVTTLAIIGLVAYALMGEAIVKVFENSDSYKDAADSKELNKFFVDILIMFCWPLLLLAIMVVGVLGFVVNALFDLYYRFKS